MPDIDLVGTMLVAKAGVARRVILQAPDLLLVGQFAGVVAAGSPPPDDVRTARGPQLVDRVARPAPRSGRLRDLNRLKLEFLPTRTKYFRELGCPLDGNIPPCSLRAAPSAWNGRCE